MRGLGWSGNEDETQRNVVYPPFKIIKDCPKQIQTFGVFPYVKEISLFLSSPGFAE